MRLRQLVLACGFTSFVLSPYVSALGLGEVTLKSSLNQPLEAEVKLLDTRDLTAEQILITLASPADFERNGVDRLYFYTEMEFQVVLDSPDGPKVIMKSRSPVREPYLNFLVEARWTAGRLLREYTLLMDLPTFEDDVKPSTVNPAPAAAAPSRNQGLPSSAAPRAATARTASAAPSEVPASTKSPLNGDQYEVRANDTLWEIALSVRPDSGVSVHQSMMALYRANPEAFINGDINKLRRGQILRVPDSSDMKSINRSEAVSQFAQATNDPTYGAQLNASRRAASAGSESTEVSGRVKLAAPSEVQNNTGQGSGANDGAGKALEAELAATLEELDRAKSEGSELTSRVKDLEAQLETMERLVAVSNEKLRALQVAAAEQPNVTVADNTPVPPPSEELQAPAAETPVASDQTGATEQQVEPAPVTEAAAISSAESSSVAAVQPPLPAAPKPQNVVQPAAPKPSFLDTLTKNPLWLGLAGLGVIGIGAGIYINRRRKQAEEELAAQEEDDFALDDSVGEQEEFAHDDVFTDSSEPLPQEEEEESAIFAETGDVVGEADIYIAYGKLDQAEEMLLNGLQKDPASTDIRMKLLEIYVQQQNAAAFNKQYAALVPLAGAALMAQATQLRESLTDAGAASGLDEAFEGFSLDSLSDELVDSKAPVAAEHDVPVDSGEFNFDFGLDDEPDVDGSVESPIVAAAKSEFGFDVVDTKAEKAAADQLDNDFSFDFDDDLALVEAELEAAESLDVPGDDFNLDLDVADVDLAALEHEMESFDVDFDKQLDADTELTMADLVGAETAKDKQDFAFDLDEDLLKLDNDELHAVSEDLDLAALVLTDDLDKSSVSSVFEDDADDFTFDLPEDEEASAPSNLSTVNVDAIDDVIDLELDDEIPVVVSETDDLSVLNELAPTASKKMALDDDSLLANLSDDDMDLELDFLVDADESATKLDLARAYIDMGDNDGAKEILSEVIGEGTDEQRKEANELLGRIG